VRFVDWGLVGVRSEGLSWYVRLGLWLLEWFVRFFCCVVVSLLLLVLGLLPFRGASRRVFELLGWLSGLFLKRISA
jgi:hypothetical protein